MPGTFITGTVSVVLRPLSLRVTIRRGEVEIEISGTSDQISTEVGGLTTLMGRLEDALLDMGSSERDASETPRTSLGLSTDDYDIPTLGRVASGSEAITRLLSTEWGNKPRNIGEIRSALASNAMPYPNTTISGILVHLVKTGKVKRWKTAQGYVYRGIAMGSP